MEQIAVRFFVPNDTIKKRLLYREVVEVSRLAEAVAYAYHTLLKSPKTENEIMSVEIERVPVASLVEV